jgi:hypothetical protein
MVVAPRLLVKFWMRLATSVIEAHVHTAKRFRTNFANCPRIFLATTVGTFEALGLEHDQIVIIFHEVVVVLCHSFVWVARWLCNS